MPPTLTITLSAGAGGTINPSATYLASVGDNVTVTITPSPGFRIASVVNDSVSDPTLPLSVTWANISTDHSLAVTFQRIDWINAIADALVNTMKSVSGPAGGYTANFTSAVVERAPTLLDWATLPRPYVGVRFMSITDQTPYGGVADARYRASGDFSIGIAVDISGQAISREAPERLAAIYAQDVMRALALDVNLAGLLDEGIAQPGEVTVTQSEVTGAYVAFVSVTVHATWVWHA